MATPTKPPSHEPIKDPFDLEGSTGPVVANAPIPTGLSDEDDAPRLIAQKFNPDLWFCTNCEGHYDVASIGYRCPRCMVTFSPPGTRPDKYKFTPYGKKR